MSERHEPTRWSRIEQGDLDYVVRRFWRPVRRYIARRVGEDQVAEDLTQELFLGFLQREVLERADRERGPFHRFLFHCAEQLVTQHYRAASAQKRRRPRPLDGSADAADPGPTPREAFEREWFLSRVNEARRAVKAYYLERGQQSAYRAFRLFYFGSDQPGRWTQAAIAAELGLGLAAVNNHIARARRRFAERLREGFADGLLPDAVEAELRALRRSSSGTSWSARRRRVSSPTPGVGGSLADRDVAAGATDPPSCPRRT